MKAFAISFLCLISFGALSEVERIESDGFVEYRLIIEGEQKYNFELLCNDKSKSMLERLEKKMAKTPDIQASYVSMGQQVIVRLVGRAFGDQYEYGIASQTAEIHYRYECSFSNYHKEATPEG